MSDTHTHTQRDDLIQLVDDEIALTDAQYFPTILRLLCLSYSQIEHHLNISDSTLLYWKQCKLITHNRASMQQSSISTIYAIFSYHFTVSHHIQGVFVVVVIVVCLHANK